MCQQRYGDYLLRRFLYQVGIAAGVSQNSNIDILPPARELQRVFDHARDTQLEDAAASMIARQVEDLTRRSAEIAGAYKRIEMYFHRLRDMGLEQTFDLLGATEREALGLAVFLLEQLDSTGASDYSAPAIHFSSVIKIEVQLPGTEIVATRFSEAGSHNECFRSRIGRPYWNRAGSVR